MNEQKSFPVPWNVQYIAKKKAWTGNKYIERILSNSLWSIPKALEAWPFVKQEHIFAPHLAREEVKLLKGHVRTEILRPYIQASAKVSGFFTNTSHPFGCYLLDRLQLRSCTALPVFDEMFESLPCVQHVRVLLTQLASHQMISSKQWSCHSQTYRSNHQEPDAEILHVEHQLDRSFYQHCQDPKLHHWDLLSILQHGLRLPLPFCVPLSLPTFIFPQKEIPEFVSTFQNRLLSVWKRQKTTSSSSSFAMVETTLDETLFRQLILQSNSHQEENNLYCLTPVLEDQLVPVTQCLDVPDRVMLALLKQLMIWLFWMNELFGLTLFDVQEQYLVIRQNYTKQQFPISYGSQDKCFYSVYDLDHKRQNEEEGVWIEQDPKYPWCPVWTNFSQAIISQRIWQQRQGYASLDECEEKSLFVTLCPNVVTTNKTDYGLVSASNLKQILSEPTKRHHQRLLKQQQELDLCAILSFSCFQKISHLWQDKLSARLRIPVTSREPITALDVLRCM